MFHEHPKCIIFLHVLLSSEYNSSLTKQISVKIWVFVYFGGLTVLTAMDQISSLFYIFVVNFVCIEIPNRGRFLMSFISKKGSRGIIDGARVFVRKAFNQNH